MGEREHGKKGASGTLYTLPEREGRRGGKRERMKVIWGAKSVDCISPLHSRVSFSVERRKELPDQRATIKEGKSEL